MESLTPRAGGPRTPSARLADLLARPFVRFLAVGAANTLFSYAVFRAVLAVVGDRPHGPAVAQVVSYTAGIATGFLGHRRVTFRAGGAGAPQLRRFVVLQLTLLALTTVSVETLITRAGWPAEWSWLVTTVAATLASFVLQRRVVFTS